MSIKEIIRQAAVAAEEIKLQKRAEALRAVLGKLEAAKYKVGFVGQFKTGKSTLINRVILKQNILFTDVMEATAIPTEIEYADRPRLEVYRLERKPIRLGGGAEAVDTDYVSGCVLDRSVDDPTLDAIREHTSADTAEARADLAGRVSHVRLGWPAPNLRGITVVDTPGINSTNDAVVTTTYRILPDCDATVFVTTARQLSQVDVGFLRSRIFDAGLGRCLVVINHDRRFSDMSPEQLEKLRETIRAQLADMGREAVPVAIADAGSPGGLPGGALGDHLASPGKSPAEAWLGGLGAEATPMRDMTEFEGKLITFLNDSVRPGREEKAGFLARREIEASLAECQVELGLLDCSEEEKERTREKVKEAESQFTREYQALKNEFLQDFKAVQRSHRLRMTKGLDLLQQRFSEEIERHQSIASLQAGLSRIKDVLQMEAEEVAVGVAQETRQEVVAMEQRYAVKLRAVAQVWEQLDVQLKIDGGLLEKAPSWLVTTLDILLVVVLLPFPWFLDLIVRWFATKVPGIKGMLPATLALGALKAMLQSSSAKQFEQIRQDVEVRLKEAYATAETKIQEAWDAHGREQLAIITEPAERASLCKDPQRKAALESAVSRLKGLLAKIPAAV